MLWATHGRRRNVWLGAFDHFFGRFDLFDFDSPDKVNLGRTADVEQAATVRRDLGERQEQRKPPSRVSSTGDNSRSLL